MLRIWYKTKLIHYGSGSGLFRGPVSDEGDESGPHVAETRGDEDDDSEATSPSFDEPDELNRDFNQKF